MVSNFEEDMEALFHRISSPESRRAGDSLFSASGADLAKTYKPGRTEAGSLATVQSQDSDFLMLSIDHLQTLPPILDFEASSLADGSFPISAGLRLGNCLKYWIIKPQADWIDWSLVSQSIHGLKRSYIEDHGIDAIQVYDEMRELLVGTDVIYSDNPYWEQRWLACLGSFDLAIRDIQELLPTHNQHLLKETFEKQFQAHKLIPHRADHDALALSLAVYHLQNR